MASIVDPFHQSLHQEVVQLIDDRTLALARGSASVIPEDRATVAEKYAAAVAYIQALNDVLDVAGDIEKRIYVGRVDHDKY